FKSDGLFGKLEDAARKDSRSTPPPAGQTPPAPRAPYPEPAKQEAAAAREGKGSKLIVGPDIKLKGAEITDCDTLVVEGRVEAAMDSRVIQIAEQGVFHATGKVTGKVRYGKLSIEEGGELSGDVGALSTSDALSRNRPATTAKPLAGLV